MPYKDPVVQLAYQRKWMRQRRAEYFKYKVCEHCQGTRNLQLDHIDKTTKVSHRIWSWSKRRQAEELAKCQVLCSMCHSKKDKLPWQHGMSSRGYHCGCRCVPCVTKNNEIKQAYRAAGGVH